MGFIKHRITSFWENVKTRKATVLLVEFFKNRDVIVFIVFLFISTSFWFFNALHDKYVTEFNVSLRLINVPNNQVLKDASTHKIKVQVQSTGYSLLRQYISNSLVPINFDVNQLHRLPQSDNAYLLSRDQHNIIKEQFLVGIDLLKISPDTIFISLEPKETKKVPVKFLGDMTLQKQYTLSGNISFNPDSIEVSGQKSIVDTLTSIYTTYQRFPELADTVLQLVNLQQVDDLAYSDTKTELMIPVEIFSERSFAIPLKVVGMQTDSLRLKIFPPEVNVVFRAGLSKFEKVSIDDFKMVVDASQLMNSPRPQRLKVRMESVPENIQSYDFSPLYVEYLLEIKP